MSEADRRIAIGIDIGGSGIKGAAVDVATGELISERIRVLTPQPSTPQAVIGVIARIVKRTVRELPEAADVPIGVGVPSVVIDGVTKTAANIDAGWDEFDADQAMRRALKRSAWMVNDADAAGAAEMRFGAGAGRSGTVIVLTLGTGVGSAIYTDGILIPNTELGHMEIRGRDAERRSAAAARTRRGLSWKAWAEDLDEHLNAIHRLFWPKLIILGGGVSKRTDNFLSRLTVRCEVIPAAMRNEAGIVGAALVAVDRADAEAAARQREAEATVPVPATRGGRSPRTAASRSRPRSKPAVDAGPDPSHSGGSGAMGDPADPGADTESTGVAPD
jgi:polyphosphate glucokinase